MSSPWFYAVGTLLVWVGWFLVVSSLVTITKFLSNPPAPNRAQPVLGLVVSLVAAALSCIAGSFFTRNSMLQSDAPWRFPIVWFVMPFAGWLCVVSAGMTLARLLQALLALNGDERLVRLKGAGLWLLAAILGGLLFKHDEANKIEILRGGIPFQISTALVVLLISVAAVIAMVIASREATTRGAAKAVVAQIALLTGSVVFGIPFVFLLITSFKEPEDMSSPNGIVWIPKVSETLPYFDKADPEFETGYKGMNVVGHLIGTNPDGTAQFDILRPHGLSGTAFTVSRSDLKEVPKDAPVVSGIYRGTAFKGEVIEEMQDGRRKVQFLSPLNLKDQSAAFPPAELEKVRHPGLNWRNYPDALEYLPPEADRGLVYLKNTLILVILNVLGTILSSAIVAYAFSRMKFPGRGVLFSILLSTMMLPAAVTLLPTFLIFRDLHAVDTLVPLWLPAFFGSAFNIFLLRQFFMQIPMELEDAAKIDGCTYLKTFWAIMLPQIKPALAVIAIWTFMGSWNNFMGPLIYVSSPEHMPLSYALQLFQGDRGGDEPGLVMAFATMCMIPVLALFFGAQRYFIEGVTLSGLGGR